MNKDTNSPINAKEWLSRQDIDTSDKSVLIKNELSAETLADENVQVMYDRYLNAAKFFDKFAKMHNLNYTFIKAFRSYKHLNTDINISISTEKFPYVIEQLQKLGWSQRGIWSRFKENIAEHGKRKLTYKIDNSIADIHLYPGLSWHGLEYVSVNDVNSNQDCLHIDDIVVNNTNYTLDLLTNVGHALFERYKFTAGEVFHLGTILQSTSEAQLQLAQKLALKNGWGQSFDSCLHIIRDLYNSEKNKFPVLLPKTLVKAARNERMFFHYKNNNYKSLVLEFIMTQIWSGKIYTMYSRLKKSIYGRTGEEAKYGAFK